MEEVTVAIRCTTFPVSKHVKAHEFDTTRVLKRVEAPIGEQRWAFRIRALLESYRMVAIQD